MSYRRANADARRQPLQVAAAVAAASAAIVAFDPAHRRIPLCPLHATTGLRCPLCGGLRAVNALARGDMHAAVHSNLLFVALVPVLAAYWLDWARRSRRGLTRRAVPPVVTAFVVAAALVFTVLRNVFSG